MPFGIEFPSVRPEDPALCADVCDPSAIPSLIPRFAASIVVWKPITLPIVPFTSDPWTKFCQMLVRILVDDDCGHHLP